MQGTTTTGHAVKGYEIHLGRSEMMTEVVPFVTFTDGRIDGIYTEQFSVHMYMGFSKIVYLHEIILTRFVSKKDLKCYRRKFYLMMNDDNKLMRC